MKTQCEGQKPRKTANVLHNQENKYTISFLISSIGYQDADL